MKNLYQTVPCQAAQCEYSVVCYYLFARMRRKKKVHQGLENVEPSTLYS